MYFLYILRVTYYKKDNENGLRVRLLPDTLPRKREPLRPRPPAALSPAHLSSRLS